ncbi:PREDICTED: agamous-like MADS-box protein AGL97 [Tarenaya hassleriana]|uniref:agamous-like MADS-box protein AGL97 n=1 Tax=Tarenaya hassleriana TaxID=28532 RepID=UPI00053C1A6B|nr:PREDICTED: agamous-like MADS-box protein AGL97 [Tarenaya hassleriana]
MNSTQLCPLTKSLSRNLSENSTMGGRKRKIPMEKIEKKESRSVAFSKRREGLYRKASELCLLCDTRIAILVTPPSAKSNVSFYSFGHSSVDDVVDAFLHNRPPTLSDDHALSRIRAAKNKDRLAGKKPSSGLGFRWEEDGFEETDNIRDLEVAIYEISELMNSVRLRQNVMKNQRPRLVETTKLGESSVQGLDNDGGKHDETLAGDLAPQVSDQPIHTEAIANSDICFEELGEEPRMGEASLLSENDLKDPVDGINFDDFADFSFDF